MEDTATVNQPTAQVRIYLPGEPGCRVFRVSAHYAHSLIDRLIEAGWTEAKP